MCCDDPWQPLNISCELQLVLANQQFFSLLIGIDNFMNIIKFLNEILR